MRRDPEAPPFCLGPGHLLHRDDVGARIHRRICGGMWRGCRWGERARMVLRVATWRIRAVRDAIALLSEYGDFASARSRKSRARLLAEEVGLALWSSIPPRHYYMYRLYERGKHARRQHYLYRFETKYDGAYKLLRSESKRRVLSDKRRFWEFCRAHGLPTAKMYLEAREGRIEWLDAAGRLPPADLFLKPRTGRGGGGAGLWIHEGGLRFRHAKRGDVFEHDALLDRFRARSAGRALLVQERLPNHESVARFGPLALCTVRVVTIQDERGVPEPTIAVFRMAAAEKAFVDNIHAGGIAAAVDLETGALGRATPLDPRVDWMDRHPLTGAVIAGERLPMWNEVLDLVRRAHEPLDHRVLVGWDVGLCPQGPVLVEGNGSPCVDLLQRPHDRGLAETRFGELLLYHLERAQTARRSPVS